VVAGSSPQGEFKVKITKITAHAVKSGVGYQIGGRSRIGERLPKSDYYRLASHPQLYSDFSEALVLEVETDEGLVGWGETQAPIGPEIAQTIVQRLLGPAILGRDPLDTDCRFTEMYETMRVRGQSTGYQLDAMAGLDTALWDIRGRAAGLPISRLLGGRYRETLPCYVSGLRRKDIGERLEEAIGYRERGIAGVKPFMGYGVRQDCADVAAIREAIGPDMQLMVDAMWRYSFPQAVRVGRALEEADVAFFEAPLAPEDIHGHARLAAELDVAIAVGEPLRSRFQFMDWLRADAMDICQPDIMRNGITESMKVAVLSEAMNRPVAFHTGCVTAIGMAATFHLAAAASNFLIQEYQPVMFETFNPWLEEPLRFAGGEIVVPDGPGLGISINRDRFLRDVASSVTVTMD
jgi:D-galactarolactone cycloisomerase